MPSVKLSKVEVNRLLRDARILSAMRGEYEWIPGAYTMQRYQKQHPANFAKLRDVLSPNQLISLFQETEEVGFRHLIDVVYQQAEIERRLA